MNTEFLYTKDGFCKYCQADVKFVLHKNIMVSGADQFCWVCEACAARNPDKGSEYWIRREKIASRISEDNIQNLPVIMPQIYTRCAVCGARATETHHWAPRAIFQGECNKWPTDQLCKRHHDEWHRLVTPQLVQPDLL